jgi:hypothetical protein
MKRVQYSPAQLGAQWHSSSVHWPWPLQLLSGPQYRRSQAGPAKPNVQMQVPLPSHFPFPPHVVLFLIPAGHLVYSQASP